MRAERETSKRRGGSDRRAGREGAARRSTRPAAESGSARRARGGRSSAPAREARAPKSGPQTSPIARPVERQARPKNASQAKARAKARKAKAPKVVRPRLTERLAARLASVDLRPRTLASKVPFVVLIIGALGIGLGLTLWLSTDSAERSYKLSHARERNRLLQQQKEALERDVREAEAAPALAEAARKQGMIPSRDTAHLVQDPSGNWVVVGTPKPADGVAPPPLNTKLPDEAPQPPKPPAAAPEVATPVEPAPGGPALARSGPEALLRAPDGASTVGGQHLAPAVPPVRGAPAAPGLPVTGTLPGMPGGPATGVVPGTPAAPATGALPGLPTPGLPMPAAPATPAAPAAEVPIPLAGLPIPAPGQVPAPLPAEIPVPLQLGRPAAPPQPVAPATPANGLPGPAVVAPPGVPR
ncbi:hypothetical protein [Mycobacterium sp. E2479]|uniref:hypothetical protein n=1 Tax=Mycobacterium sp. E2479 TaxID=1834134 RepID=UPI0007FFEA65|nr:hypothetical protein [Mycobacterium sp. E2479]OBH62973.1 hypothetical protein A5686_18255 [Mycobacterium sp. E2479]